MESTWPMGSNVMLNSGDGIDVADGFKRDVDTGGNVDVADGF